MHCPLFKLACAHYLACSNHDQTDQCEPRECEFVVPLDKGLFLHGMQLAPSQGWRFIYFRIPRSCQKMWLGKSGWWLRPPRYAVLHLKLTKALQKKTTFCTTVDGKKSGDHQLSLYFIPIIYKGFSTIPGGWPWDFWTINSMTYQIPGFSKGSAVSQPWCWLKGLRTGW